MLCLSTALLAACGDFSNSTARRHAAPELAREPFSGAHPVRVVCTTGPVADMVRNIGGAHLNVVGLMGPGVDPHLYRAALSDIQKLDAADVIFFNGLHLEGRMADLFEDLAARKPTFAVTRALVDAKDPRLRQPPEFAGYYDPHLWHDAALWADCAKYVTRVLGRFDPAHADDYGHNGDAYQHTLRALDQYCRARLATIPQQQRALVTAHDAFGYFCIAYNLESIPLKRVSTEDEVDIGRMDEVVHFLVKRKVKAVFIESAVAPRIVESLIEPCAAAGHQVRVGGELYADALGPAESGADTYVGMLRANVKTIVSALGRR